MLRNAKMLVVITFIACLGLVLSAPSLQAEDHVVSTANLHQAVMSSAAVRQNSVRKVEGFLSSPVVQDVARKSGYNLKEVQQAIPSLSDQELARLVKTTNQVQSGFAAGALTHTQLTLIIAAAIVVVIILALKA